MLKPDRSKGIPGMYGGFSPEGNPVLIKVWPRSGDGQDGDLEEIWRHELRQLHRLAGYPGATGNIAQLHDAGYDARGFYLVIAPGQRQPLQTFLNSANSGHWLKQPRQPANRARIWANLSALAGGLETLHSQGLLHRNLDAWAVLTSGGEDVDFQLTGFEWSMRIVGADATGRAAKKVQSANGHDSFLTDWLMFGDLAASLLGVRADRLYDKSIPAFEVAEHLGVEEARLLRNIVQMQPMIPIDGEAIAGRIDEILRVLSAEVAKRDPKLYVAMRLGQGSLLAERIREASGGEIETADNAAQIAFVRDDLYESPMLLALKMRDGSEGTRLVLRGKHLSYALQAYRPVGSTTTTWEFAYCESVERTPPAPVNVVGHRILDFTALELLPLAEAVARFPRLRGKLTSWEELRRKFITEAEPVTNEQMVHRALSLVQFLEALYGASDVYAVEVMPFSASTRVPDERESILRLRTRVDPEREDLARALNLKAPAVRMAQALTGDGVRPEGWILTDTQSLGDRSPSTTEWQFERVEQSPGQPPEFLFSGTTPAPLLQDPVLVPEGSLGRDVQFRRRLKALKALKDHEELLGMIADPRKRVIESHDAFKEDDAFRSLDGSKQDALRELTSTIPLYLVQGPPGVGKTRLVRDLVRRRFAEEPTSRLLLTAQSNAAIDHLMDELEPVLDFGANAGPLVVRCTAKDSTEAPSRFDIREQSAALLSQLSSSKMSADLPPKLRAALNSLAAAGSTPGHPTATGRAVTGTPSAPGRSAAQALRAFEGVVARAANVVFATTNSSELERLIEERGQFDWAIVEEAGKATGCELISPLMLSHRRLMIGDHRQLPPFASDHLIQLLRVPEKVAGALDVGEEFVGRSLRDSTTDEILDETEEDGTELPALCAEALRVLTYFESAIEAEFTRQKRGRGGKPIAKKLNLQHRMHPAIASLVSRCFYARELKTHDECVARYASDPRPYSSSDLGRLPLSPIVIVDMPYVQSTVGQTKGDQPPRWHNPLEVDAVIGVLRHLVASPTSSGKPPTLAVLSPYSQQVRRLDTALREERASNPMLLKGFGPPVHSGAVCHTVDSFQGSEADVVVVSLVRNNQHSNIRNALGFLTDLRRMNVLLSRARWQLILVASLEFLGEVVAAAKGDEESTRIVQHIADLLDEIRQGQQREEVSTVSPRQLLGGT